MITKLTTGTVVNKCSGAFRDRTPCTATNTYYIGSSQLIIGASGAEVFQHGPLLIMPKAAGYTLKISNPNVAGPLMSSKTGSDFEIVLAYNGTSTTSRWDDVYTELTTAFPTYFAVTLLSYEADPIAINLAKTSLPFRADSSPNIEAIRLPQCPTCTSYEFYFRTFNSYYDLSTLKGRQRAAVNFLWQELKRLGYVNPNCKTQVSADSKYGIPVLPDYPTGDGTL